MRSFLSAVEDFCTFSGAVFWSLLMLSLGAFLILAAIGVLQDRFRRRATKPPVEGWDLEPWVENPPYAERSCHPLNVDIDCGQCRRWLAARNNPPAGVS